ncbi:hypothetical protein EJ08DRAFT_721186 [Tothia fuscella]|uniref:Uncharacterized protein n=1 Tax=Tothia fuscella TaxID=1048955 RepID=A0A9P4NMP8_9PEZI|nr:hypothetical protein EJ08DRAFT_721186 [Tothia fuscella]
MSEKELQQYRIMDSDDERNVVSYIDPDSITIPPPLDWTDGNKALEDFFPDPPTFAQSQTNNNAPVMTEPLKMRNQRDQNDSDILINYAKTLSDPPTPGFPASIGGSEPSEDLILDNDKLTSPQDLDRFDNHSAMITEQYHQKSYMQQLSSAAGRLGPEDSARSDAFSEQSQNGPTAVPSDVPAFRVVVNHHHTPGLIQHPADEVLHPIPDLGANQDLDTFGAVMEPSKKGSQTSTEESSLTEVQTGESVVASKTAEDLEPSESAVSQNDPSKDALEAKKSLKSFVGTNTNLGTNAGSQESSNNVKPVKSTAISSAQQMSGAAALQRDVSRIDSKSKAPPKKNTAPRSELMSNEALLAGYVPRQKPFYQKLSVAQIKADMAKQCPISQMEHFRGKSAKCTKREVLLEEIAMWHKEMKKLKRSSESPEKSGAKKGKKKQTEKEKEAEQILEDAVTQNDESEDMVRQSPLQNPFYAPNDEPRTSPLTKKLQDSRSDAKDERAYTPDIPTPSRIANKRKLSKDDIDELALPAKRKSLRGQSEVSASIEAQMDRGRSEVRSTEKKTKKDKTDKSRGRSNASRKSSRLSGVTPGEGLD